MVIDRGYGGGPREDLSFYLIGSTAIFLASVSAGLVLIALSWRPLFEAAPSRELRRIRRVCLYIHTAFFPRIDRRDYCAETRR